MKGVSVCTLVLLAFFTTSAVLAERPTERKKRDQQILLNDVTEAEKESVRWPWDSAPQQSTPSETEPDWAKFVGRTVIVEGVAWDKKDGSKFFVAFVNGKIDVQFDVDSFDEFRGRPVRVAGRLVCDRPTWKVPRVQSADMTKVRKKVYRIEEGRVELIEQIEQPELKVVGETEVRGRVLFLSNPFEPGVRDVKRQDGSDFIGHRFFIGTSR